MSSYLVVDDSPTIRLALRAALRNASDGVAPHVDEASTEGEAVDVFMNGRYDLVFLDMMLDGNRPAIEVLRAMLAARPDARVVLMTGLEREHPQVVEAVSMGAFGYLRKPVRTGDVRDMIHQLGIEHGSVRRLR